MPSVTRQRVLLALLSALSIYTGIKVTYYAVQAPPKTEFDRFAARTLQELRAVFGLTPQGRWVPSVHETAEELEHFLFVLLRIFKDLVERTLGRALFMLVFSMTAPLVTYATLESVKVRAHFLMNAAIVTLILLTGQVICVGAALPIFYVPIVAFVRGSRPMAVFPEPGFAKGALNVMKYTSLVTGPSVVLSSLVPTTHFSWVYINLVFQFFPLVYLLLAVYMMVSTDYVPVSSHRVAQEYRSNGKRDAIIYWASLGLMVRVGFDYAHSGSIALSDSEILILWDMLGVALTLVYMFAIDVIADPAPTGVLRNNLHEASAGDWVAGTLNTLGSCLVWGPGATMAEYFARREDRVAAFHSGQLQHKSQ